MPRAAAVLSLLLAISIAMQTIPATFYPHTLRQLRQVMLSHRMELLPQLLARLIAQQHP